MLFKPEEDRACLLPTTLLREDQTPPFQLAGESHVGFALTALPGANLLKRLPNMVKKVL